MKKASKLDAFYVFVLFVFFVLFRVISWLLLFMSVITTNQDGTTKSHETKKPGSSPGFR
jgi:hypothetical protein